MTAPLNPHRHNYSLFGNARKDHINDTQVLSAQVGLEDEFTEEQRQAHQSKLLDARLNTFIDAMSTPFHWRKLQVGSFEMPYTNAPVPAVTDIPWGTQKSFSFNENKAFQKLKRDFARCDKSVRENFIKTLSDKLAEANTNTHFAAQNKLSRIEKRLKELDNNPKEIADLASLSELKDNDEKKSGLAKIRSQLFGETAAIQRKIAAIESPSSYQRHIADTSEGEKVTDRPLYVHKLRDRQKAQTFTAETPADAPLQTDASQAFKTKREIQEFTKQQFELFSNAISEFQKADRMAGVTDQQKEVAADAIKTAALPILRSKDRLAVHRFVRDMTRQLKRAGVAGKEFEELKELIPNKPSHLLVGAQSLIPGLGKQMRRQDEAMRMAEALPKVLRLTVQNKDKILRNLMSFNLDGPRSLALAFVGDTEAAKNEAVQFLKSPIGKKFGRAIASDYEQSGGKKNRKDIQNLLQTVHPMTKPAKYHADKGTFDKPPSTAELLNSLSELLDYGLNGEKISSDGKARNLDTFVRSHQHLFMQTSDTEFWERESVAKLRSRFKNDDSESPKSFRIFKQMQMRGAALGMKETEIEDFMGQGISNTLKNRNMFIQGSKAGGIAGAVAGNFISTPVSGALIPLFGFYVPTDPVTIPATFLSGAAIIGLAAGPILGKYKRDRLRELSNTRNDFVKVTIEKHDGKVADVYTSASPNFFTRKAVQKPSVLPQHYTFGTELKKAHGPILKGVAMESVVPLIDAAYYAFYEGIRQAVEDLIRHRPRGMQESPSAEGEDKRSDASSVVSSPSRADVGPYLPVRTEEQLNTMTNIEEGNENFRSVWRNSFSAEGWAVDYTSSNASSNHESGLAHGQSRPLSRAGSMTGSMHTVADEQPAVADELSDDLFEIDLDSPDRSSQFDSGRSDTLSNASSKSADSNQEPGLANGQSPRLSRANSTDGILESVLKERIASADRAELRRTRSLNR